MNFGQLLGGLFGGVGGSTVGGLATGAKHPFAPLSMLGGAAGGSLAGLSPFRRFAAMMGMDMSGMSPMQMALMGHGGQGPLNPHDEAASLNLGMDDNYLGRLSGMPSGLDYNSPVMRGY